MTPFRNQQVAVLVLAALVACSRPAASTTDRDLTVPIVSGTVVDARTGEPLSSVTVHGPADHDAKTDSDGRFEMTGLALGATGDLTVKLDDGRTASVHLRPLRKGRVEVVLHLASP